MNKMRLLAAIQSSYIPWKGYFDIINAVDDFVLYDTVQYTRRDWRNRNQIKTPHGLVWLTIPVEVKGKYLQKINETKIANNSWAESHLTILTQNYLKAPYFNELRGWLTNLYEQAAKLEMLSEINYLFIEKICSFLGITTQLHWSSDFALQDGKTERLVDLCKQLNATKYLSGPSAKCYMDIDILNESRIELCWANYSQYKEYNQLYPPFTHGVSILDLLFHTGADASSYLKTFNGQSIYDEAVLSQNQTLAKTSKQ
jgi:hypothetical protein